MEAILNSLQEYDFIGLFLMRLIMGFMFTYSSINKMKDIPGFSKHNEIPVGLGYIVVIFELLAGVGLILGIYTQIAALLVMGLMTGTMFKHIFQWKSPYWAASGGWEYDLIWFIMALTILLTGGGQIAIFNF
jgi:putative oxidoreductase